MGGFGWILLPVCIFHIYPNCQVIFRWRLSEPQNLRGTSRHPRVGGVDTARVFCLKVIYDGGAFPAHVNSV